MWSNPRRTRAPGPTVTALVICLTVASLTVSGLTISSLTAAPSPANAATPRSAAGSPPPDDRATVVDLGSEARDVAYQTLGDRPFQAVLMSGERAVMTASSRGSSPFTDVPIASIAKLITAMTAMRLVEMGALSLERTIGQILPASIVPERWRSVTVAQLLSHTSGFAADRDRWFNDTYSSCFDAFRRIVARDAPGAAGYEYSNTNFCALSLIIGSISGPSYEDAAYRLLFRPLGIQRKTMDAQYANLAGAGGWRMSALDVARVLASVDPAATFSPLSSTTRASMITPTSYNYGRGVWIWDAQTYGHSGSLYRARNIAVRLPSGRVVVILTQATFPDSGLDLLPIAQKIDAAFGTRCTATSCQVRGLDPFQGMSSPILGRIPV